MPITIIKQCDACPNSQTNPPPNAGWGSFDLTVGNARVRKITCPTCTTKLVTAVAGVISSVSVRTRKGAPVPALVPAAEPEVVATAHAVEPTPEPTLPDVEVSHVTDPDPAEPGHV
jgi:hypothetical protein